MREAFGGSWLLGFVALFIVLFSAYLAVSINYTKAFKAKNKIINIIEQNEGMSKSVGDVRNKTDEELNKGKTTEDKIYYFCFTFYRYCNIDPYNRQFYFYKCCYFIVFTFSSRNTLNTITTSI